MLGSCHLLACGSVVRDPHSVRACAALKTTCWRPADPLRSGMALGDSESLSMFCQEAYPCADGTRLALEHCSPLRQKGMVGVPLEMCLMPVKVSAGTLAQSFSGALNTTFSNTHTHQHIDAPSQHPNGCPFI